MPTNTIRLHRVLRSTPERVYRAFIDADAMAKWLPPNGFTGKVHHVDARVGGTFRMSFTNFTSGATHAFGGEFLELVPHERIRYTDRFDDPNLPGVIQVTVTLRSAPLGTDLGIVQEGVPDVIPLEACYLGWQESLALLAKLVEADVARAAARTGLKPRRVEALFAAVPPSLVPMPDSLELVKAVRIAGHRLIALSNLHRASFAHLARTYDLFRLFDGHVVSCEVGACKPQAAIYRHLLERHALDPRETVFIDDMQANLDAAAAFGIRTIRFEDAASCRARLREAGGL